MQLIKCPRCDLNYIREDEKYCKVCLRELKGEKNAEEVELCSICNEEPALPGRDVCIFCLKEMNKSNSLPEEQEEENAATACPRNRKRARPNRWTPTASAIWIP